MTQDTPLTQKKGRKETQPLSLYFKFMQIKMLRNDHHSDMTGL